MRKPGCIEPIIYFVNGTDPAHEPGFIMLAPYSDFPTPAGYRCEAAETLPEARKLEAQLVAQERRATELELLHDEASFQPKREAIRDKLYARMTSSATGEYEKEFLRLYMDLRDERKRRKYEELYLQRTSYLWALHHDLGSRRADVEEFKAERHTVDG